MARAAKGRLPALTALPTSAMDAAISCPCPAIQRLCHISITTAMPSTPALNNSWPAPSKALAMVSAKRARRPAPTSAASTPAPTHRPRPGTPRVTANTIPMIRPASMTSRNTMISAPNMSLFRDHDAFGGIGMKLANEFVSPGRERTDADECL